MKDGKTSPVSGISEEGEAGATQREGYFGEGEYNSDTFFV